MPTLFHSPVRRPPPTVQKGDANSIDPNEALLDEFYLDNSTQALDHGSSAGRQINRSIVEEFGGFNEQHYNNNNNARRRRVDYDSVDNDEPRTESQYNNNSHLQQQPPKLQKHLTWNRLNSALFVGLALLSAATSAPITMIPTMALSLAAGNDNEQWSYAPYYVSWLEVYDESGTRKRWVPFRIRTKGASNNTQSSSSIFASHLTSVVTLVTAFGKFINGAIIDVAGARRLLLVYGMCTCLALLGLRYSNTPTGAIGFCAAVEFFSSINWPASVVILGAHYGMDGNDEKGKFERGLYITSLASRCGSLLAIPLSSLLLKWTDLSWRGVAGLAAWGAFGGVVVFYLYLTDSPGKVHDPQNPIRKPSNGNGAAHHPYHPAYHSWSTPQQSMSRRAINFISSVYQTVLPSIRAILGSRVFWAVAVAHSGATMVKSSERIMGTYFKDTSFGVVSESKAGAMTVFLSVGMLGGLLVGGTAFAKAAGNEQGEQMHSYNAALDVRAPSPLAGVGTRNMIAFLYCLSICMCYMLSFFAMPFVRRALHLPVLVLILQVLTTFGLGFGVAVQYYLIPAIVGATYGKNRGLYTAYTDGVAALVSSVVWRIVGGAVEEGNPQRGGWAYGWAAVALLLILCGSFMVKIVELYFVGGGWRHDTPKDSRDQTSAPAEFPSSDLNSSWMEDELLFTEHKHGSLNILSSSALEFIGGSPRRVRIKKFPESRDEMNNTDMDLLGIDDDGSLLLPSRETAVFDDPHNSSSFEL